MEEASLQRAMKLIKGEGEEKSHEGRCEVSERGKSDVELLDAYSRAVITVVEPGDLPMTHPGLSGFCFSGFCYFHFPRFRSLLEIFPGEKPFPFMQELIKKRLWVMVIYKDKGFALS
jgi:hypothetical protein